ncbi:MAG: enoyl-CoA hydratase/isomerase family protein [Acidimicrobiia bacterium]|nr:enoyl-CoA hydratase/isomerase family protein [Acidimicrobiia bacterium]
MEFETVEVSGEGPVRHLVLNRPEVHNAVNPQLIADVQEACLALEADPSVRVIIVRGAGKSFCSGADLKAPRVSRTEAMLNSKRGARMADVLTHINPITIAACHGYMIGGGVVIPACCDFRIGAPSIKATLNEVSIGFNLNWHTVPALIQLVGPARAKEMLLFGRTYDADTLLRYGYLNEVVGEDELVEAAERYAAGIVAQPPVPVTVTKASINAYSKALDRSVQHMDAIASAFMSHSPNSRIAQQTYFSGEGRDWVEE